MEILSNLYFEDFYRRSCNSSKNLEENEINGQAARSRQTFEVATESRGRDKEFISSVVFKSRLD